MNHPLEEPPVMVAKYSLITTKCRFNQKYDSLFKKQTMINL